MGGTYEMTYVGHNHFSSKEKKELYNIIQVLYNSLDEQHFTNKATLINIFVDDDVYNIIARSYEIGTTLKVEVKPILSTGKISYKIIL